VRIAVLAVGVVGWLVAGCASSRSSDHTEPQVAPDAARGSAAVTTPSPPRAPEAAVYLSTADGGEVKVATEVVNTPATIERGLMYRQHLPPDQGMLFLMEERRIQSFWMKNTLIPLDMIFIDEDLTVAGIVENTEPLTRKSRRTDKPSRYVLEVNGGWCKAHGVVAGARARFENVRGRDGAKVP
jgi:uncharacterized membrane protein (UPF0127 family)